MGCATRSHQIPFPLIRAHVAVQLIGIVLSAAAQTTTATAHRKAARLSRRGHISRLFGSHAPRFDVQLTTW
jgi:hypothetical protein